MERISFVYFITNKYNNVLYTGVTTNLDQRMFIHRNIKKEKEGYTQKYKCTKLVYYESFGDVYKAIQREKQLKGWSRKKKDDLINKTNPEWKDLLPEYRG